MGTQKLFIIQSSGVSVMQGLLEYSSEWKDSRDFQNTGVHCWGVSVKWGSTVCDCWMKLFQMTVNLVLPCDWSYRHIAKTLSPASKLWKNPCRLAVLLTKLYVINDWMNEWMIDQLTDWLIDWSIDWLIDWLMDWAINWSIDSDSPNLEAIKSQLLEHLTEVVVLVSSSGAVFTW